MAHVNRARNFTGTCPVKHQSNDACKLNVKTLMMIKCDSMEINLHFLTSDSLFGHVSSWWQSCICRAIETTGCGIWPQTWIASEGIWNLRIISLCSVNDASTNYRCCTWHLAHKGHCQWVESVSDLMHPKACCRVPRTCAEWSSKKGRSTLNWWLESCQWRRDRPGKLSKRRAWRDYLLTRSYS